MNKQIDELTKQNNRKAARDRYNRENTTFIGIRMNNSLYSLFEKAFSENSQYNTKSGYAIQAIKEKMERDGYNLDNLATKE